MLGSQLRGLVDLCLKVLPLPGDDMSTLRSRRPALHCLLQPMDDCYKVL